MSVIMLVLKAVGTYFVLIGITFFLAADYKKRLEEPRGFNSIWFRMFQKISSFSNFWYVLYREFINKKFRYYYKRNRGYKILYLFVDTVVLVLYIGLLILGKSALTEKLEKYSEAIAENPPVGWLAGIFEFLEGENSVLAMLSELFHLEFKIAGSMLLNAIFIVIINFVFYALVFGILNVRVISTSLSAFFVETEEKMSEKNEEEKKKYSVVEDTSFETAVQLVSTGIKAVSAKLKTGQEKAEEEETEQKEIKKEQIEVLGKRLLREIRDFMKSLAYVFFKEVCGFLGKILVLVISGGRTVAVGLIIFGVVAMVTRFHLSVFGALWDIGFVSDIVESLTAEVKVWLTTFVLSFAAYGIKCIGSSKEAVEEENRQSIAKTEAVFAVRRESAVKRDLAYVEKEKIQFASDAAKEVHKPKEEQAKEQFASYADRKKKASPPPAYSNNSWTNTIKPDVLQPAGQGSDSKNPEESDSNNPKEKDLISLVRSMGEVKSRPHK